MASKKKSTSTPPTRRKPATGRKAGARTSRAGKPAARKLSARKQPAARPATRKKGTAEALLAYAFLSERDYADAVRLVAEGMFGGEALVSDGDALGFDTPDGGVFVEAQRDPRIVRVAAHLGATRGDADQVARLTSQVTARLMLGRVIETDNAIFFVVDVPAEPFVPLHAAQAIVTARAAAPEIRSQLAGILDD